MVAMVVVGSGSTDPQKFTKDYCGLFTDSGVMPKRHLARFPVTSNSVGSSCELNSSTPVLSGDSTWYSPYCFPFHNWSMGWRIWQDSGKRWSWKRLTKAHSEFFETIHSHGFCVEQICFSKASMAEWNDGGSTECLTCTELQSLTEELVALEVAGQRFEQSELVMVLWFWSLSVQSMAWSEDAWKCWRQIQMGLWIASLAD